MSNTVEDVVGAYGAAWLETAAAARLRHLQTAWSDAGIYQDPSADVAGRQGLCDHIGGFHESMPGAKILITSGIDAHHGKLRFNWQMLGADGAEVMAGIDFAELAEDGRLAKIIGFFGPPPPAA